MIDFHSHILPNIDDGSRSVEESAALLSMLWEQGVDLVCATPHFDPAFETPVAFLERREKAKERVLAHLTDVTRPRILLGAEVAYYAGISRMQALPSLRLEGSPLLLLEMPIGRWSEYTVKELKELSCYGGIRLLLAHVERYMLHQSPRVWEDLLDHGILMQVNASYFINFGSRQRALRQLKRGEIHALGSDCHNVTHRPPKVAQAIEVIRHRLGEAGETRLNFIGSGLIDSSVSV